MPRAPLSCCLPRFGVRAADIANRVIGTALVATAAILAAPAAAMSPADLSAEWTHDSELAARPDWLHAGYPAADGGFWLHGAGGLLRYRADGTLTAADPLDGLRSGTIQWTGSGLVVSEHASDVVGGNAISADRLCEYAALADGSSLRWLSVWIHPTSGISPWQYPSPMPPLFDVDGGRFDLVGNGNGGAQLVRFGERCDRQVIVADVDADSRHADIPNTRAAYLLSGNLLSRVSASGTDWRVTLDPPGWGLMRVDRLGRVLVSGGSPDTGTQRLALVEPDGTLRWQRILPLHSVVHMEMIGDSLLVVERRSTGAGAEEHYLRAFDPAGNLVQETALTDRRFLDVLPQAPGVDSAPRWRMLHKTGRYFSPIGLAVPSGDGSLSDDPRLPAGARPQAELADGRLLAIASAGHDYRALLIEPDGSTTEVVPRALSGATIEALQADADGVVTLVAEPDGVRMRAVGVDGIEKWNVALQVPDVDAVYLPEFEWRLALGKAQVCAAQDALFDFAPPRVSCHDRASGAALSSAQPLPASGLRGAGSDRSGRPLLWRSAGDCGTWPRGCGEGLTRVLMTDTLMETELVAADTRVGDFVSLTDDTLVAMLQVDGAVVMQRIDTNGTPVWTQPLPTEWFDAAALSLPTLALSGGRLLAAGMVGGSLQAVAVDAESGSIAWRRGIEAVSTPPHVQMAAIPGGWLLGFRSPDRSPKTLALAADGSVRWQQPHELIPQLVGSLASDGLFAIQQPQRPALDVELRSADDNRVVHALTVADAYRPPQLQLTDDGQLYAVSLSPGGEPQALRLRRIDLPARSGAEPAVLTQPGLRGSWYRPDTRGEGLYLDHLADSGVLYGAWFTRTVVGGDVPSALRWYLLHGNVAAGERHATVDILQPTGGAFAEASSDTLRTVGEASLQLDSCKQLQLHYAFDPAAADGGTGRTPLIRTAAPSRDCNGPLATATTVAPEAAARGGPWFDPATDRQGLFVEPVADGTQTRFAAFWFTFDPAGSANDPSTQHWFTMVSAPVDAAVTTIELQIQQTVGGAFDREPTDNTYPVGSATLSFSSCNSARLDYRFDEGALAAAFAGRSGSASLQRLGGCGE